MRAIFGFALAAILIGAAVYGCQHATVPPVNPAAHPFQTVTVTITKYQTLLTRINVISFVALLASIGAAFYFTTLTILTRLVIPVLATVSLGTLVGAFAIPFFPWLLVIVGVPALAFGGYEVYVHFFKKTPPAAPTPVQK